MQATKHFIAYAMAFEKKLQHVEVEQISATPYIKNYLAHLLQHKKYYLAIYADVLEKLLQHSGKNKSDISVIDFGAGNGLLGIFAKFCGFKKVFLQDIDADFIKAAQKLAMHLEVDIDGYITGDIGAAKEYFTQEAPDAIIGTDVIEHIYSLESFLATLRQMNPSMLSVFTTASNPSNYFKVKQLKKLQLKDELEGGVAGNDAFFGNSPTEPFLSIRRRIIHQHKKELSPSNALALAKATRGLKEPDIIAAVERYGIDGQLPEPASGNNTCDPLTGCWTERILPLKQYTSLYEGAGFKPVFYNGFYNVHEQGLNNKLKKVLNFAIPFLGSCIAPYILIVGSKK